MACSPRSSEMRRSPAGPTGESKSTREIAWLFSFCAARKGCGREADIERTDHLFDCGAHLGIALQHPKRDLVESVGGPKRIRIARQLLVQDLSLIAGKRESTRDHLVENDAERIDVGRGRGALDEELLGRDVPGRAGE